ncbi:MAG: DUF814 domain-containing protein [Candidatus Diapherotrites archaeon]|nr:DUF814 domain-containing protein [Candidatus Diapherotrites archaeon]
MTEVRLSLELSAQENAQAYFARAKKAKRKMEGLLLSLPVLEKKLSRLNARVDLAPLKVPVRRRKREWFEKFHWFFSSDGFLVIAGRDARSNEIVIRRHLGESDVFFHADIFGAPHTVLVSGGRVPSESARAQAAAFAGIYSSAWKSGLFAVDVYSARADQVSKQAPSGESVGKGAFMVYGERQWFRKVPLELGIGVDGADRLMAGPLNAIRDLCPVWVSLGVGTESKTDAAKRVVGFLKKKKPVVSWGVTEVVSLLPAGGFRVLNSSQ